jgi:uncharacterized protein YyaL (SSP411 family)
MTPLKVLSFFSFFILLSGFNCNTKKEQPMSESKKVTNRLINEKSPYLLQHATNPVDWYAWGEEAFEKAKKEDKPIFLSIGYATCHWCHVMEHESFEDEQVAALMNETFISIKVDREERPDVDDVYMTVCQMVTGSGGWPLTIIMTPDKEPFFAGTYIPKHERYGRAGMLQLIPRIKELWENHRDKLLGSANKIKDALSQASNASPGMELRKELLEEAFELFNGNYDAHYGGFGNAPKFPTAHNLMFLLRYWKRTSNERPLQIVETTLQRIHLGGIYDHIGFGFHRYSTDREWLVPHFEKMLYDQAILSMAYTEAYQATRNKLYKKVSQEILEYVLRDMIDPLGGFYSAEDADSEGEEGKFYMWTEAEIKEILPDDKADLIIQAYNVKAEGNFIDEATRTKTGANILHLQKPLKEIAEELKMEETELQKIVNACREKLFEVREARIHPLKDDKILTDWNGLMIAALAKAASAFEMPEYADAAKKASNFIRDKMLAKNGRLLHRYRDGEVAIQGFLDDYAFMIWGLLELYQATFEVKYLKFALDLNQKVLEHFWDAENWGFFFTPDDGEEMLVRKKQGYDGAIPSGNSVMMLNLIRLGRITGNTDFENKASQIGQSFSKEVTRHAAGYSLLMSALDFTVGPSYEIVLVADQYSDESQTMIDAINGEFIPNKIVILKDSGVEKSDIMNIGEFTRNLKSIDGKATAYVCKNFQCDLPTTEVDKMMALLRVK